RGGNRAHADVSARQRLLSAANGGTCRSLRPAAPALPVLRHRRAARRPWLARPYALGVAVSDGRGGSALEGTRVRVAPALRAPIHFALLRRDRGDFERLCCLFVPCPAPGSVAAPAHGHSCRRRSELVLAQRRPAERSATRRPRRCPDSVLPRPSRPDALLQGFASAHRRGGARARRELGRRRRRRVASGVRITCQLPARAAGALRRGRCRGRASSLTCPTMHCRPTIALPTWSRCRRSTAPRRSAWCCSRRWHAELRSSPRDCRVCARWSRMAAPATWSSPATSTSWPIRFGAASPRADR